MICGLCVAWLTFCPQTNRLKQFHKFQGDAIAKFCELVGKLANPKRKNDFVSQATKLTLGVLRLVCMVLLCKVVCVSL